MTHDTYEDKISDPGCLEMRAASGRVDSNEKLVVFLYLLCRDHLAMGEVEEMIDRVGSHDGTCQFTNGWLADWAKYTASKVQGKIVDTEETYGYVVLTDGATGVFDIQWDAELHPTQEAAEASAETAREGGWEVHIGRVVVE